MGDAVTFFVDDGVMDQLPPVCVKDGVVTGDRFIQSIPVGRQGLGAAWLLLFFGPVGLIVLVLVAYYHQGAAEQVTVHLPMSDAAYQRLRAARRADGWATAWLTAAGFAVVLAIVSPWNGDPAAGLLLAVLVGGAVVSGVVRKVSTHTRLKAASVELVLDGSRRWVSIWGVHPAFVDAVHGRYEERVSWTQ